MKIMNTIKAMLLLSAVIILPSCLEPRTEGSIGRRKYMADTE